MASRYLKSQPNRQYAALACMCSMQAWLMQMCWLKVLANDGSGAVPMGERHMKDVLATVAVYGGSSSGLRCLALAFRQMPANHATVRACVGVPVHAHVCASMVLCHVCIVSVFAL